MKLRSWLLAAALLSSASLAEPTTLILVRHADKAAERSDDPALSEAGLRRAQQLAEVLGDTGVRHIVTTQWRRTRDTAAPLAARLGLQPQVVATRRGANHVAELAAVLRGLDGTVLVVGHSNTVPDLIAAFGGPKLPMICESRYGHLLVLRPADGNLLRLRYGDADPPPEPDCF
jgi:broad specificity phosphatase PhoE